MPSIATKAPDAYLERVDELLSLIKHWSHARGLIAARYPVQLSEEEYGSYTADGLHLSTTNGDRLGSLIPVGASIIGAKGRVDFQGTVDQAILVDWEAGGPVIESHITAPGSPVSTTRSIYRGVDEAGWYWVESRRLARAHKLDERLFWDLLFLVSDYDLRR